MARKKTAVKKARSSQPQSRSVVPSQQSRSYTILDHRLEKPSFTLRQVRVGDETRYEVESGDLSVPLRPFAIRSICRSTR